MERIELIIDDRMSRAEVVADGHVRIGTEGRDGDIIVIVPQEIVKKIASQINAS